MCDPIILGAGLLIGGGALGAMAGGAQAESERQAGRYQAAIQQQNAAYAEMRGARAREVGAIEAGRVLEKGLRLQGAQRALMAGGNVVTGSGSGADVQAGAGYEANVDVQMTLNNAALQAWGYEVEAQQQREGAAYSLWAAEKKAQSAMFKGFSSFLSGGASAVGLL